jgi:predicted dehydrogenase
VSRFAANPTPTATMKFKTIGNATKDALREGSTAPASDDKGSSSLTRRNFLRNSSTAGVGVGLIVTSKTALGQEGTKPSQLRCGIIGCGEEGEALRSSSLPMIDDVRFTAVADVWPANRRSGAGRVSAAGQGAGEDGKTCTPYEDPQEMIDNEDLDCILVATPDFVHHTHSIMGLEAGLDVYSEKLMSNSIEWCRDMCKAQERTGKLLQIGHQRRSNPRYLHARNVLVNEQKLLGWITHMSAQWNRGKSSSVPREVPDAKNTIPDETLVKYGYNPGAKGMFEFRNWRMYKKFGGGVISDLGAHQIDLFNWFLGTTPNSVFAQGGTDYYTGEYLHDYLTTKVKEEIESTKSKKRKAKLEEELAIVDQIRDGYEYADNVMAFYEYETERKKWGTKGGAGDKLKTRAYYQVLTTTNSQGFFEKFMGENATMAISEVDTVNQIYREAHDTRFRVDPEDDSSEAWGALLTGKLPLLQKTLSKVYNRFWEKPAPWRSVSQAKHDKWLDGSLADSRVSKPLDPYELPDHVQFKERPHTPHLRNFFETVAKGGTQDDLNCSAVEGFKTAVTCIKVHEAIEAGTKIEFKPEDFVV